MPRFSIIIPCYNAAPTLAATLDSLTAQRFADWEAFVIDDGSDDDSPAIAAAHALRDPRIRVVANPGKGPSDARNAGALELARGEIIAFCDADDLWTDDKLSTLDTAFDDTRVDGVFARIGFFRSTPADSTVRSTVPDGPLTVAMLLGENPVCTMSNMAVRRDVFRRSGGFANDMVHNEDLEWLVRLVASPARVVGLPELQVWYRTSTGGLSADLRAMEAARDRVLAAARRHGVVPTARAEAVHLRYLARRALRLNADRMSALRLCLRGITAHPAGFLFPPRRGLATALAACIAPLLSRTQRARLFAR